MCIRDRMYSLLTCGASCLFLIVFKQGIAGYFNALIIANIVSIIFLGIACGIWKDIIYTKLDMNLMRQMLTFSIPLIFNAVSWWVANSSDRLMLNYFTGAGDVGLYSVAAKIPSIITSITSIFNQAWMISSVTEYDSNNESTFFSKTLTDTKTIIDKIVATRAKPYIPAPHAIPTAAETQRVAAVVKPKTVAPCLRTVPPPIKPIPVTT